MIRILHIEITDKIGGIEKFLMNVYDNIDRNKVQFDFVSTYKNPAFYSEFIQMGSKVYKICSAKNIISYYKSLKAVIKDNDYQIVHIHKNSCANIIPFIVCKKLGVKCIIAHAHNTSSNYGLVTNIMHKTFKSKMCKIATNGFGCSEDAIKWLFTKKFIQEKNVNVIKNGIDVDKYTFSSDVRKKIRTELGFDDNDIVLCHVGRFVNQKNHKFLIEVYEQVLKKDSRYKLLLIGVGPLKKDIEQLVCSKHIENSVIFLGERKNVDELIQGADLFLFPSLYEGLSVVTIEAQALGIKIFCSDTVDKTTNVTETIKFIPIDSINPWVDNIIRNSNRYERFINKSKIISSGYDIKNTANYLINFYLNSNEVNSKYQI